MTRETISETRIDQRPRCSACNKLLAVFLTRPWRIDCNRCGATNVRFLEPAAEAR